MRSRYTLIIVAAILGLISLTGVDAQSGQESITADNIDQLTQIGAFDGECATFHPDEAVIATTTGLYDLDSGEQRVDLTGSPVAYAEWVDFSPDGKWAKMGSRIYAAESGDIVLDIGTAQAVVGFSQNGNYAYVHGLTYETPSWQETTVETIPDFEFFISTSGEHRVWRAYTSGNGISTYLSPRMNYWVHVVEGIYDVSTGDLLDLPPELNDPAVLESGVFSPDDSLFFVGGEGIDTYTAYQTASFTIAYEMDFDMGNYGRLGVPFSPNGQYFGIAEDGIYETATGERLFEISGIPIFSPDNTWVATQSGFYELSSGSLVTAFSGDGFVQDFSDNGELVAVYPNGVFDLLTQNQRFAVDENVRDMRFSADSSLLYGRSITQEILIYNTATGEVVQTLSGFDFRLSPQEQFLALQSDANCTIYAVE